MTVQELIEVLEQMPPNATLTYVGSLTEQTGQPEPLTRCYLSQDEKTVELF